MPALSTLDDGDESGRAKINALIDLVNSDLKNESEIQAIINAMRAELADAQAGTSNNVLMTAVRTRQAISALIATLEQAQDGDLNNVLLSPERGNDLLNAKLPAKLDATFPPRSGALGHRNRPGRYAGAFTSGTLGGEDDGDAVGTVVTTLAGPALQVTGTRYATTRERYPVYFDGLDWRGFVALKRAENPEDPSGDSVEVRVFWLDRLDEFISSTRVFPGVYGTALTVEDGRQIIDFTFGKSAGVTAPAPSTAASAVVVVLHFGVEDDGKTDLELIHVEPATGALALARLAPLEVAEVGLLSVTPSIVEWGGSVTPTVNWSVSGTATIKSQVIDGESVGTEARSYTPDDPITSATAYTLRITDQLDREKSAVVEVDFRRRMYWGVSSETDLDSDGVNGLTNTALYEEFSLNTHLTAEDEYIYIVLPRVDYDDAPPKDIKIDGHKESMVVTLISVTTPVGSSNFRVLRSQYKITGTLIPVEVVV